MININFKYDQNSVRLLVEGIPDTSIGHDENVIGILTSWKLQILGFPELEGKKEHLQKLMSVILSYSRNYISGVRRSLGDEQSQIRISSTNTGHKLVLFSSKEGIQPLELNIDDAELLDLTRALDQMRTDKRVLVNWGLKIDKYIPKSFLPGSKSITNRLMPPFFGLFIFSLVSSLFLMMPSNRTVLTNPAEENIEFKNN